MCPCPKTKAKADIRHDRRATIGQLAKRFGLSRSALLYYDSIGLLQPSGRTAKGYRIYTEADAQGLKQICQYRQVGIPLQDIKRLLNKPHSSLSEILRRRLDNLNKEILQLQEQQRVILGLLENQGLFEKVHIMNRERFLSLLSASGIDQDAMMTMHARFELFAPKEHRQFLELLCFSEKEIRAIRASAKAWGKTDLQ